MKSGRHNGIIDLHPIGIMSEVMPTAFACDQSRAMRMIVQICQVQFPVRRQMMQIK